MSNVLTGDDARLAGYEDVYIYLRYQCQRALGAMTYFSLSNERQVFPPRIRLSLLMKRDPDGSAVMEAKITRPAPEYDQRLSDGGDWCYAIGSSGEC